MSRETTQFVTLPNEIIYHIFDCLTALDILQAFGQLNRRYNDIIHFHIKRIDLTDDWQGDHHQLQWVCGHIQTLRIDQRHLEYLSHCRFNQLHSLGLINVVKWQEVISHMNLRNLSVSFDKDNSYCCAEDVIPKTVVRFSSNAVLDAKAFHTSIIHLSLCVPSIAHLLEIVERTPNIQQLFVSLWPYYHEYHDSGNQEPSRFETLTSSFRCLVALKSLSISVTYAESALNRYTHFSRSNERHLFDQIQMFIARCCPSKVTLKRVALQFNQINLLDDLWSTFIRYKNTFDRFDFYVSLIITDKISSSIDIPSTINPVGSHLEGSDPSRPHGYFLHVYSLPFAFNSLYGFTSFAELNTKCSFPSVRYLYFTTVFLSRPISFQSLVTHMPRLLSIDCVLTFSDSRIRDSDIDVDSDIFYYVHSLSFSIEYFNGHTNCGDLLSHLLRRMPYLRKLVSFGDQLSHAFNCIQHPLMSIKMLDLRHFYHVSFDILPQYVPSLSTLLLSSMTADAKKISEIMGTLFIRIPSLNFVSYRIIRQCSQDRTPYGDIAREALTLMKKMDNSLSHLSLSFGPGLAEFSRQNTVIDFLIADKSARAHHYNKSIRWTDRCNIL